MPDKTKEQQEEEKEEEVVAHTRICLAGQLETGLDSTETILAHTHTHTHVCLRHKLNLKTFPAGRGGGVACCVC